jgi:integral membrane sensor domain MASE1
MNFEGLLLMRQCHSSQTHIGMAFLCNALAGIAGPPALGAVITATGQYWQGKHRKSEHVAQALLTRFGYCE